MPWHLSAAAALFAILNGAHFAADAHPVGAPSFPGLAIGIAVANEDSEQTLVFHVLSWERIFHRFSIAGRYQSRQRPQVRPSGTYIPNGSGGKAESQQPARASTDIDDPNNLPVSIRKRGYQARSLSRSFFNSRPMRQQPDHGREDESHSGDEDLKKAQPGWRRPFLASLSPGDALALLQGAALLLIIGCGGSLVVDNNTRATRWCGYACLAFAITWSLILLANA